jgi:hypothetical protein
MMTYASSLLTKSPNPGVSTTVNFSRTPFSSTSAVENMSVSVPDHDMLYRDLPALLDSIATVRPFAFPFILDPFASERGAPKS